MLKRTWIIAALLAATGAAPLWAQDDTTSAEAGEGLSTSGEELGETYVAETHTDWEVRCLRVAEGEVEPCQMFQLLTDGDGRPVAEFNLINTTDREGPDGATMTAGATIVTPLDTLLIAGMRFRIDEGAEARLPFRFCQQIGCFVQIDLSTQDMDALRAGGEAYLTIVPLRAPDQEVELEVSLAGFTAAFEDLEARGSVDE